MNPELLTCQRLTSVLLYSPTVMQPVDLTQLYAEVTQRYPYQTYQQLPDGARMSNADNDIFVQSSRTQVTENIQYFNASKVKCLDVFDMVRMRFNISQFLTLGVKLLALLPMDKATGSVEFIEQNMLRNTQEKLDILGEGRQGTGLRIRFQQDEATHDLRIDPFFSNLSQIYVELDTQYTLPFTDLTSVEMRIDSAYGYLFKEVKNFLASFND